MMKYAILAAMLVVLGYSGRAYSQPTTFFMSIFSDGEAPYADPGSGRSHAFLCLSASATVTKTDTCYGFFPRPDAITAIALANGGFLVRNGAEWIERPGKFHFVREPGPADKVVLYDSSRQMTWTLSVPKGVSQISYDNGSKPWVNVTSVTFEEEAPAFIGGDGLAEGLAEPVGPPAPGATTFRRQITAAQRKAVLATILLWNTTGLQLSVKDYINVIESIADQVGASRPRPTVVGYLSELVRRNGGGNIVSPPARPRPAR